MGDCVKQICKFLGLIFMTGVCTYGACDSIGKIFELIDEE
jgi:hypothetical protein